MSEIAAPWRLVHPRSCAGCWGSAHIAAKSAIWIDQPPQKNISFLFGPLRLCQSDFGCPGEHQLLEPHNMVESNLNNYRHDNPKNWVMYGCGVCAACFREGLRNSADPQQCIARPPVQRPAWKRGHSRRPEENTHLFCQCREIPDR